MNPRTITTACVVACLTPASYGIAASVPEWVTVANVTQQEGYSPIAEVSPPMSGIMTFDAIEAMGGYENPDPELIKESEKKAEIPNQNAPGVDFGRFNTPPTDQQLPGDSQPTSTSRPSGSATRPRPTYPSVTDSAPQSSRSSTSSSSSSRTTRTSTTPTRSTNSSRTSPTSAANPVPKLPPSARVENGGDVSLAPPKMLGNSGLRVGGVNDSYSFGEDSVVENSPSSSPTRTKVSPSHSPRVQNSRFGPVVDTGGHVASTWWQSMKEWLSALFD